MIILIIIAFILIALFEIPALIQKRYWRELVVFSALLCVSFSVSLLFVLRVNLPYISDLINQAIKKIFNLQ